MARNLIGIILVLGSSSFAPSQVPDHEATIADFPVSAATDSGCSCQGTECVGCGGGGCPSTPILERQPAISLYWNDPGCCLEDPCLPRTCVHSIPALWYVGVEGVFLARDQLHGDTFQQDATTGQNVLRESLFDSPFDAGVRVTFGAALGDVYRLEATYLGSLEWQDSLAVRNNDANAQGSNGNLFSPFSDFGNPAGLAGFDFNNFASIQYSSDLSSTELNLRRRFRFTTLGTQMFGKPYGSALFVNKRAEGSFLLGIRHLQIDEGFAYASQSAEPAGGTINQISTATSNDMIGAQIGLALQFANSQRSWIDVDLKGGIYSNEVTLDTAFASSDGAGNPVANSMGADQRDVTSWVGELSLMYNHMFARNFTFRIGYSGLVAADVAVAAENFTENVDFLTAGPVAAHADGDLFYHGPSLGVTWTR